MRKDNVFSSMFKSVRDLSDLHKLYALYALALVIVFTNMMISCDTPSYFRAWDTLKTGTIDIFRTPLYPLIIGVLRDITGSESGAMVLTVLLQSAVFGVSIKFFYRTVALLSRPGKIPFYITAWYVISPSTSLWSSVMITESLSISLTVIWIYTLIKIYRREASKGTYVWSMLVLLALYMLRPAFVYLGVVSVVFCLMVACNRRIRRHILMLVASQFVPLLVLLGYCVAFRAVYGVFTPSSVSMINQMTILRANGANFDSCADEGLKAELKDYVALEDFDMYDSFMEIRENNSLASIDEAIKQEISDTRWQYLAKAGGRLYRMSIAFDTTGYLNPNPVITALSFITFDGKDMLSLTILGLVYLTYLVVRRRDWRFLAVLMLMVLGAITTSVLGAQAEWVRLSISAAPVFMMLVAMIASNLQLRHKSDK